MMTRLIFLVTAAATASFAQQWEIGGLGGGGFLNHVGVTAPAGTATAGFANGAAFGGYVGYNSYKHIGGGIPYRYLQNNLRPTRGRRETPLHRHPPALPLYRGFSPHQQGPQAQVFQVAGARVEGL